MFKHTIHGGSMHIEIKIKEVRQSKKISISELSRLSGISKGHISKIERQEVLPSIHALVSIAIALKVDATELYEVIK